MTDWTEYLNREVMLPRHARLVGGFTEPFYQPQSATAPAEIRFTRDYERSALHELAHWCIAGDARRQQHDYGYWYEPDGRSGSKQQLFFRVEVKPQALERHFCDALGIQFDVSVDNLDNTVIDGVESFRHRVGQQYNLYATSGLPERASVIYQCLQQWQQQHCEQQRLKKQDEYS